MMITGVSQECYKGVTFGEGTLGNSDREEMLLGVIAIFPGVGV
jgi:hypothetical protein